MDGEMQDLRWKYWDLASCCWADSPAPAVELPEQREDEPVDLTVVRAAETALQLPG